MRKIREVGGVVLETANNIKNTTLDFSQGLPEKLRRFYSDTVRPQNLLEEVKKIYNDINKFIR